AAHYGNNARIAPLASLQDGVLDVVVVDEVSILQAAALLPRLFRGTIDKSRHVTIVQEKRVEIHRPSAGDAHLDGEPVALPARLSVEIVPRSLRVLIPDTMERIRMRRTALMLALMLVACYGHVGHVQLLYGPTRPCNVRVTAP